MHSSNFRSGTTRPSARGSRLALPSQRFGGSSPHARGSFGRGHRASARAWGSREGRGGRGRNAHKQSVFNPAQYINKAPVLVEDKSLYMPQHSFTDFGLDAELARRVIAIGYTAPTPIQDSIIPHVLTGKDIVGTANTGTGKTAAFLIPLIQKILTNRREIVLVLAPTRELVIQIERELRDLTAGLKIYSTTCVGGVSIGIQLRALKNYNNFIVGTPGRIKDLIQRKAIVPGKISTAVLDEADRMLDMGFIADMRSILALLPKARQTLLFSATMSNNADNIVHEFLKDPVKVSVARAETAENIAQDVVKIGTRDKVEVLYSLLDQKEYSKVIVFGRTKYGVENLCNKLARRGIKAVSIHGNKSHSQRQSALKRFKDSLATTLVATDVAARGIHIDNVSHVINFDLPGTREDYIHRIGRTGRGSDVGMALTFVP
jgi:ATP-dependent RNA helicase RhlE